MANNPYVNKVQLADGTSLIDISDSTVVASDVSQGKYFYLATGEKVAGTATGGGSGGNVWQDQDGYVHLDDEGTTPISVESLSVTQNGTYTAPTGTAYSPVTVNVSGGASAWTKVAETSYQVSTTSTSAETVATWETGHSEIWTSNKIVYVRIRDTAGKRSGYFYGIDAFFMNYTAKNHPEYSGVSEYLGLIYNIWRCDTNGYYASRYGYNGTGYGVYPDYFYDDGRIRIRMRYNSSYTLTINGTYKVEVYLLDPPTGTSIFT